MPRPRPRAPGFTLLEVCLAIFIALLVAMAAVPSLTGLMDGKKAERSFTAFDELVQRARARSLEERRPFILVWDKEGVELREESGAAEPGKDEQDEPENGESDQKEELSRLTLGEEETLSLNLTAALQKNPAPIWTFWPSGVCEPATVTFKGERGGWSAVYNPFTAAAVVTYE